MDNTSAANTRFGLDLFCVVCDSKPNSNGFISPFSIAAALSMTQLGARGETALGMMKALRWEVKDESVIHEENKKYITLLQKPIDEYILSTANKLYIEQGFSVLPAFLEQTRKFYLAEGVCAQFKTNAENERVSINTWVAEQTHDKIRDLLAPGVVNSDTKMVLVNAIYFKGLWTHPFDPISTKPKPFKVSGVETKEVPTMFAKKSYSFWMDDGKEGFSALEIPYKGDGLSMVILLPSSDFGLTEMEKKLTFEKLTSIFSKLQFPEEVELFLPKFEMTISYQMKVPLCQMGMASAFSQQEADFTGMTETKELMISDVVHKAFIKVNEEGSEAAAATAAVMMLLSFEFPQEVPVFVVDHPFFFVIRDKRASNSILFMGHVIDPSL